MRIERQKVSSLVFDELKKMIKSGEFPPNSKLPTEMELAKLFGVSRSPVREALSILQASGLIESHQGGGSWVKEVNLANMLESVQFEVIELEQVRDLLEMRSIIETEAASLAAERHTAQDIKDLADSLEAFSATVKDEYTIGYEADYAFHRIIVRSAYNPFLTQTMDQLSELHLKALEFSLNKNLGRRRKRAKVYAEHQRIFDAIKARNSDAAKEAVYFHLTNVRRKLGDERMLKDHKKDEE